MPNPPLARRQRRLVRRSLEGVHSAHHRRSHHVHVTHRRPPHRPARRILRNRVRGSAARDPSPARTRQRHPHPLAARLGAAARILRRDRHPDPRHRPPYGVAVAGHLGRRRRPGLDSPDQRRHRIHRQPPVEGLTRTRTPAPESAVPSSRWECCRSAWPSSPPRRSDWSGGCCRGGSPGSASSWD